MKMCFLKQKSPFEKINQWHFYIFFNRKKHIDCVKKKKKTHKQMGKVCLRGDYPAPMKMQITCRAMSTEACSAGRKFPSLELLNASAGWTLTCMLCCAP